MWIGHELVCVGWRRESGVTVFTNHTVLVQLVLPTQHTHTYTHQGPPDHQNKMNMCPHTDCPVHATQCKHPSAIKTMSTIVQVEACGRWGGGGGVAHNIQK